MELSDLNVFRTVVAAGGITRAVEQLHRVQSNVTTRVRQLEEELGVELFIRQGKKLSLSPAGRILLDYADRLGIARLCVYMGAFRRRLPLLPRTAFSYARAMSRSSRRRC